MDKMHDINELLRLCIGDMAEISASGRLCIEAQRRAYDLFSYISEYGSMGLDSSLNTEFVKSYSLHNDRLDAVYDENVLRKEAEDMLVPLHAALDEARFQAASAISLHEYAKEVFEIWQNSGVFARHRALNKLRRRAGFHLEAGRIGNYVAKTFDLMNEAQTRFAQAQQALFSADVSYKIVPGIYGKINEMLEDKPVV